MKAIDLFAGPGGWDVAAQALGIRPTGVEWDEAACTTGRNAGHIRLQEDIALVEPFEVAEGEHVDLLIASPPCQAFSMAGKGKGRKGSYIILEGVKRIGLGEDPQQVARDVDAALDDDRAALVLEPLRWALELEPDYLAWEQVPAVLPLWEAMAVVLRQEGYSVATGNLQAEQYDVPQTRKRAILIASKKHEVALPKPRRRKYRKGYSQDEFLDGQRDLLPWISMADALGWGMTARPSMTVTAGGTGSGGGVETFGNEARQRMFSEQDDGRWAMRSNYGTNGNADNRGEREGDEPAPTMTSKVGRNKWIRMGNNAGSTVRPVEEPAPTVHFAKRINAVDWFDEEPPSRADLEMRQSARKNATVRGQGEPVFTITGGHDFAERRWNWKDTSVDGEPRFNDQSGTPFDEDWPEKRPATVIAGRGLVPNPGANGNRFNGSTKSRNDGVRVTVQEAAILQGFLQDYPWAGTKTAQYRQVGDAVPPPLAWHVLRAALGLAAAPWPGYDTPAVPLQRPSLGGLSMAQAGASSAMVDPRPADDAPAGTITGKGTAAWVEGVA